jgi:hypothetical protein
MQTVIHRTKYPISLRDYFCVSSHRTYLGGFVPFGMLVEPSPKIETVSLDKTRRLDLARNKD